jgi:hypothetical protein
VASAIRFSGPRHYYLWVNSIEDKDHTDLNKAKEQIVLVKGGAGLK